MNGLSLYDIEQGMHEALTAWQEAEGPEQLAAAELALDVYLKAEVAKVDGIRQYLKHCATMVAEATAEAQAQRDRAKAWEARRDRLKAFVQGVMESTGQKRLEGRNGSLLLKGNGGKQPVTISDESLVPDEFCVMQGTIPAWLWSSIEKALYYVSIDISSDSMERARDAHQEMHRCVGFKRTPSLSLIAAALEQPCPKCKGNARVQYDHPDMGPGIAECESCGGSGRQGVPGCRLEPRGAHVEVK